MTFEQFQSAKKWCDDLGAVLADARWEDEPNGKGWLYLDALYIEEVQPHWPEESRKEGKWHLILGRVEWITDDLAALERRLFRFAHSEGYLKVDVSAIKEGDIAAAIAMNDLDDACAYLQDIMGQTDGGIAGQLFSNFDWNAANREEREAKIREYLAAEKVR